MNVLRKLADSHSSVLRVATAPIARRETANRSSRRADSRNGRDRPPMILPDLGGPFRPEVFDRATVRSKRPAKTSDRSGKSRISRGFWSRMTFRNGWGLSRMRRGSANCATPTFVDKLNLERHLAHVKSHSAGPCDSDPTDRSGIQPNEAALDRGLATLIRWREAGIHEAGIHEAGIAVRQGYFRVTSMESSVGSDRTQACNSASER